MEFSVIRDIFYICVVHYCGHETSKSGECAEELKFDLNFDQFKFKFILKACMASSYHIGQHRKDWLTSGFFGGMLLGHMSDVLLIEQVQEQVVFFKSCLPFSLGIKGNRSCQIQNSFGLNVSNFLPLLHMKLIFG